MSSQGATPPSKGSAQWKRNEKLIAQNPTLRAARDTSEGFRPGSTITTGYQAVSEAYKTGWDRIWGNKENKDDE